MKNTSIVENNIMTYEFITKDKKIVSISIEDSEEKPRFKIQGPKEIIHSAIGGLGFENEQGTESIATNQHLNTEAKRMFAVLEVLSKIIQ